MTNAIKTLNVIEALGDFKKYKFDSENNIVFHRNGLKIQFFEIDEKERQFLNFNTICILPLRVGLSYDNTMKLIDNMKLKGFEDWRLPSVEQFILIKDILYNRFNYRIHLEHVFDFWTSTFSKYRNACDVVPNTHYNNDDYYKPADSTGCILVVR